MFNESRLPKEAAIKALRIQLNEQKQKRKASKQLVLNLKKIAEETREVKLEKLEIRLKVNSNAILDLNRTVIGLTDDISNVKFKLLVVQVGMFMLGLGLLLVNIYG
jgi:hypothetical protein